MIEYKNNGKLLESVEELPDLFNAEHLFLDFETTSGDKKLTSLNPWHNCDVAGICITTDDNPNAYYVPVGHTKGNLSKDIVYPWLNKVVSTCKSWVNHNIKYDAHVFQINIAKEVWNCTLIDTLTLAKIIDSDRVIKGGYSEDALSNAWLNEDISMCKKALIPYLHNNKDWGMIPPFVIGEYGCQDVLTARRLFKYILANIPEQCKRVAETEIALTRVLFETEQTGLCVNPTQLRIKELFLLRRLLEIDAELADIVGRSFNPGSPKDCFEVLCNQYGLPVLARTNQDDPKKPHNPSFDKKALIQYLHHPHAPEGVVERIQEYRGLSILNSLFVQTFQKLHINNVLHPSYNQCVRTGRLSCKQPNAQQQSKKSKELILPPKDHYFLSFDYAQIEFRVIIHYIQDQYCIDAYKKNPDIDFHQWIADMVPTKRGPAKTINFMMGFGGGKAITVKALAANMEIVGELQLKIDKLVEENKLDPSKTAQYFNMLCEKRALYVYKKYHETLPTLKRTSYRVSDSLRRKGYIFNFYGRHRHLPASVSYQAFPSLCQSTAADIMKERTVALHNKLQGTSIKIVASVHDETLLIVPKEFSSDPYLIPTILNLLETIPIPMRVPIRCSAGESSKDWRTASESAKAINYKESDIKDFSRWRT